MIDTFNRTGPLMEASSYPAWAQQLIQDCSESKRRVVEHELYQRMRDNKLSAKTMRHYLIGGWPVVEQFALYMAQNLTKTKFARHPGEDMARRLAPLPCGVECESSCHAAAIRRSRASTLTSASNARIRMRTMPPNSSENPPSVSHSGHNSSGAMALPPVVMLAGWCRLFHHTTDRLMIGRLTAPTSA